MLVAATLKGEGDHVELMVEEVSDLDVMDSKKAAGLRIVVDLDEVPSIDQVRDLPEPIVGEHVLEVRGDHLPGVAIGSDLAFFEPHHP